MTTLADAGEVHPEALVMVKVYVPPVRTGILRLVPVPLVVIYYGSKKAYEFSLRFPRGKKIFEVLYFFCHVMFLSFSSSQKVVLYIWPLF